MNGPSPPRNPLSGVSHGICETLLLTHHKSKMDHSLYGRVKPWAGSTLDGKQQLPPKATE